MVLFPHSQELAGMLQLLPKGFIWGSAYWELSAGFHLAGPSMPVGNLSLELRKEAKVINIQGCEGDLLLTGRRGWKDVRGGKERRRLIKETTTKPSACSREVFGIDNETARNLLQLFSFIVSYFKHFVICCH